MFDKMPYLENPRTSTFTKLLQNIQEVSKFLGYLINFIFEHSQKDKIPECNFHQEMYKSGMRINVKKMGV